MSAGGWLTRRATRSSARACPTAPSQSTCAPIFATREPTARSSCPHTPFTLPCRGRGATKPALAAMKSAFEAAHKARFGFIDETKELVVEAVSVEAVGGGARFGGPGAPPAPPPAPAPARRPRVFSRGPWAGAR